MRIKTIAAALATVSLLSLAACKQAPANKGTADTAMASAATGLDGTWKADLASVKVDSKPSEMTLQNGKFTCPTCLPSYSIAADGAFHPLKRPYSDMTSVKVDDDHTVTITSKKGDTVVGMTKYVVSADGKTLTRSFTDSSVPGAKPVTGESTMTRVADAPSGAHALSGSWKLGSYTNMSDEGTTLTLKTDGDMLHLTTPGGISYDAKIGGPAVAIKGDSAGTMAAVTKTGDNSFTETDILDGKTISVTTMVVVADGKLHATSEDKRDGSKSSYDLIRS